MKKRLAMIMSMRYELANTWTTYRYILYYTKYSDFLVVLISVGLAPIIYVGGSCKQSRMASRAVVLVEAERFAHIIERLAWDSH